MSPITQILVLIIGIQVVHIPLNAWAIAIANEKWHFGSADYVWGLSILINFLYCLLQHLFLVKLCRKAIIAFIIFHIALILLDSIFHGAMLYEFRDERNPLVLVSFVLAFVDATWAALLGELMKETEQKKGEPEGEEENVAANDIEMPTVVVVGKF